MKYSQNALNILTVKTFKGIGAAAIVKDITDFQDVNDISFFLNKHSISKIDFEGRRQRILKDLYTLENSIDGFIAIGDKEFPTCKGKVLPSQHPVVLFYKGDITLLQTHCIAVIGLLDPDEEIKRKERKVVAALVEKGVTIISGLAKGCDSIAHIQTLQSNGKTIAILPSSLNNILPAVNNDLAMDILRKGGLLLTEYAKEPASQLALKGRYQERDRLQALFSEVVILSASYSKNDLGKDSGSRLAMGYAKSYRLQRAVIYDELENANNPKYDLNREIINEETTPKAIIISNNNFEIAINNIVSTKAYSNSPAKSQDRQLPLF